MDNDRFARTIKNARLKKGYTQSQLADLLNVSNKTISKWETGRGYPDITLLAKITSILKLDYEELLQSNEYIIQKRKKKRKKGVKFMNFCRFDSLKAHLQFLEVCKK